MGAGCELATTTDSFWLEFQMVAETPKLAEYQSYIDFETKAGDPARIQLTYERALAENCLVPDLWARYTQYLVRGSGRVASSLVKCGFSFLLVS